MDSRNGNSTELSVINNRLRPAPEQMISGRNGSATPDSERTEHTLGSNAGSILIQSYKKDSSKRWFSRVERGFSCVNLGGCLENIYRLPLMTMLHGGTPFLLTHLLLNILLGFPLVFLQLGIGQIVQQGLTKTWRAVPMFKGVGYVKLIANCLVCIYYPLYIGLALYYMIWLVIEPVPFTECGIPKLSRDGYVTKAISGQECLKNTFLESPYKDPKWFGIFVGLIAVVWVLIMICLFGKMKTLYIRCTNCFFVVIVALLTAFLVKSFENSDVMFKSFFENIKWSVLLKSEVWYFSIVQLLFSTHLGFGNVITCAGKILNKTDPFWGAVGYFVTNVLIGVVSTIVSYILWGFSDFSPPKIGETAELKFFISIYQQAADDPTKFHVWAALAYLAIFLSGLISMLAAVFTIVKAFHVETKKKWSWKIILAIFGIFFCVLSCACLYIENFELVHVLDYYAVGNLLLLSTFLEVTAFVLFYGSNSIYVDFEFILGSKLNVIWKYLWGLAPILIVGFAIWGLCSLPLTGFFYEEELWMWSTGWAVVGASILIVLIAAIYEVSIQVDYNFMQKLSSALKASREWGPTDPMLRHGWVQWRSKSGQGERDFTLRRRRTKEYVKHQQGNIQNLVGSRYLPSTTDLSEGTTSTGRTTSTIRVTESCEYAKIKSYPIQVASMSDALEARSITPKVMLTKPDIDSYYKNEGRTILNPLGVPSMYGDCEEEASSVQQGPFVISKQDYNHASWRRPFENATHL